MRVDIRGHIEGAKASGIVRADLHNAIALAPVWVNLAGEVRV